MSFAPVLKTGREIRVEARFRHTSTCIQKDKFDQRQGKTQPRGETHPGVKSYV